jgi:carbonic anhydrase/acetyltransferase-like protein (isoleucine patch superfamily)
MIRGRDYRATGPDVAVDPEAFIHASAQIYGAVRIARHASVWPNVVMRAEALHIEIGEAANIQDFVMVHIGAGTPTVVGAYCSITHHVTLHGCTIGADCLIGINATIMDGAMIGENSIIAGHAFVKEGVVIPPNSIVMGQPAEVRRTRDNRRANRLNALLYRANAQGYADGDFRVWSRPDAMTAAAEEAVRMLGRGS